MIKAGEFYCIHCGKAHSLNQVLWADRENQVAFSLKRGRFGYEADQLYGPGHIEDFAVKEVWTLNGFPKSVLVEYTITKAGKSEKKRRKLDKSARVCPGCFNRNQGVWRGLLPDAGFYPSYFIALAGVMETGKTVFQTAVRKQGILSTAKNTEIRFLNDFTAEEKTVDGVLKKAPLPTPLEGVQSTCISVRYRYRDQAKVYLIDTAGELGIYENHESEKADQAKYIIADHCDGLLALYDPRYMKSPELSSYKKKREPLKGSINLILNDAAHRKLPITIMMSGADRLKVIALEKAGIHDEEGNLILSPDCELLRNMPFSRRNIIRHCILARDVFEAVGINTKISEETGCFLVSSGRDSVVNDETVISYESTMNITYPVAWVLNQLGIMEIE
ncbi:MAG: hypothetical protein Q4B85_01975 [Lachnospiraceae bacterium]|nr:hypothetical protein [Lachnospiraceae bacterium]